MEVEDRYLDTAYGALEQAGFGARLRREDGGPMNVTVKTISRDRAASGAADEAAVAGPAALSQRVEVEGPADERLDPDLWPPSAARELVNEIRAGARLRTLFTLNQRRERQRLEIDDGNVLVTLDWVAVFRGARPLASFSILEVEAAGRGANLARLAPLIEATGFVTPEPRSKEEIARGYVAQEAEDPAHRLPKVPTLTGHQGRRPARGGRAQGAPHAPRADAPLRGRHALRGGQRGPPSDARGDTPDARRVARLRRLLPAEAPAPLRGRAALHRPRARRGPSISTSCSSTSTPTCASCPGPGREAVEPLRQAWRRQRETRARTPGDASRLATVPRVRR